MKVKSENEVAQSCPALRDPMDCTHHALPSMGCSRQEYWNGLPFPSPTYNLLLLLSRFSRVRLCATPQTAAHQALPSQRFSRQEHWSGLPLPSLYNLLLPCKKIPYFLIHIFFRDAVSDLEKPLRDFPGGPGVKNPPANAGAWVQSVAQEDAASRRAATPVHHSCWTHALEPGGRNS